MKIQNLRDLYLNQTHLNRSAALALTAGHKKPVKRARVCSEKRHTAARNMQHWDEDHICVCGLRAQNILILPVSSYFVEFGYQKIKNNSVLLLSIVLENLM